MLQVLASQERFIKLFQQVAGNPANFRPGYPALKPSAINAGVQAFTQNFRNGQVWVYVRNNEIVDAGVNIIGRFK